MFFITLLILSTLSIASSAAFFSIYGLAQIFTGSFWPVVIMASSLEAGKLISASYVYRYWTKMTSWMKIYLITAIIVLMGITSVGIFGFLSAAYQQDILPLEQKEQKIGLLTHEKEEVSVLKTERIDRKKQIDADIASLPNNYITGRQRLMESYGPELEQLREDVASYTDRIREITTEIQALKAETLEQRVHTGPIIFIAEVFEQDVDEATKWLILIIIFAFDPLAVVLTIGANMAILERQKEKNHVHYQPPAIDMDIETEKEDPKTVVVNQGMTEEKLTEILKEHLNQPRAPEEPIIVNQGMSASELEVLLEERFSKQEELSPIDQIQKTMVEEMLAKKRVTEKTRNPNGKKA